MADHNISIDVKLMSEKVLSELKSIREDLNDIKSNNNLSINIKAPNIASVTRSVNELRKELSQIAQMGMSGGRSNADAVIEALGSGFDEVLKKMDEANNKQVNLDVNSDGLEEAASRAERLAAGLDAAAGIASSLSSVFSGLGDFGGMFADSFGAMSDMFSFDALGTAKRYLTAMATKAVTGQINGILSRYDIMNTFADYMELAGVSEYVANQSLSAVDQSIRGIPIGLDEAAFRLRKYQMYLGDIDRTTAFTIGIQKAITAGGASEQMKTTAYTQIDRLLATGKLGQSRQWLSLFNGLGVSLRFLKEELGLDQNADLKEVAAQLANGSIPVNDFIDAIARLSENEGLDRAIEIYKGTIEAWRSNINNAVKRAGQNIMENVNSVMEDTLGYGITGVMKNIRDGIDTISKDAGQYIQNNPQHVETLSTAIGGLVDRVMTLDGGRFVENVVNNLGGIADVIGRIFDNLPPGFLEDFASFATTWAGPLATVSKAAQSGLGVVLGVFERMQDLDPATLIEKITGQIQAMADVVGTLLGLIPDGMLGDLMAFGLVWGKPLASVLGGISTALKDISTVATAGTFASANTLFGQLYYLISLAPGMWAAAGAATALALGLKEIKDSWEEGAEENFSFDETEKMIQKLPDLNSSLDQTLSDFETNIEAIRQKGEATQDVLDKIFETDEKIRNATDNRELNELYEEQIKNLQELSTLQSDMDLQMDAGGRIKNADAIREEAKAYVELATAKAEAQAIEDTMTSLMGTKIDAQVQKDILQRQRDLLTQENNSYNQNLMWWLKTGKAIRDEEGNVIPKTDFSLSDDIYKAEYGIEQNNLQIAAIDQKMSEYDQTIRDVDAATESFGKHSTEAAEAILNGFSNVETEVSAIDAATQKVIDSYTQLKQEAAELIDKQVSGFEEIEPAAAASIATMTQGVAGQNDELERYNSALAQIRDSLAGLTDEEIETMRPGIERVLGGGFEDRQYALGFAEALLGTPEDLENYIQETWDQGQWKDRVASLMADINTVLTGGSGAEEATREAPELFPGLQEALEGFEGLGEIDLSGFVQNIQDATTDGVTPLAEGFGTVKSSADDATNAVDGAREAVQLFATAASNKTGDVDALSGSLRGVHSAATTAAFAVMALAAAINSLHDKTVTIAVNMASGGAIRAGASAIWHGVFGAYGGPAEYLANGGHPGMAKGIDTIPAWLAPGEFVVKRSAVGLFGSHFMKRVNAMDIGGAFDALMQRVSNPMKLGYGNTYNRDNHATVNNYFYGDNGQNYSQRKAYRFAGSL